ncbi:uncharacterized protein TrAFT101_000129 [Trichoderma asperellum]|uniref:Cytochrome P450 n=1 Tax=Trichoderma asperellum (strain ATCC 204424 / CBS 433.97 / NBRC 101777) TaxID=1042311 RepID=A0A2T3YUH4_TRIA4|nr:hypothetical protein M441DRAFT_40789 [Trichoderma asperellum CBS 433.97]PTB36164.1 hypothetical protein M441DRAFT_40789 [Trichoderma asperellum CBS 433.97]UKZ84214.1 hypothetical protein TrAFT101_000129 [Trichoderma asperellum]WVH32772.1 Cytochrome P450 [Trichoderma asperellum]
MFILILLILVIIIPLATIGYRPRRGCRGAPTVPFYISFYEAWQGTGQVTFYNNHLRRHLEIHGLVNLWNTGRWSVLVTKPEYVAHVFRNERVIAKGGLYRQMPSTTPSHLFGVNIIDSTGELWKHFTRIMKPGIQQKHNPAALYTTANKLLALIDKLQQQASTGRGIIINDIMERWSMDVYGQYFLDADLCCLDGKARAQQAFQNVVRTFPHRLLLQFPLLEYISMFLLPSRRHAWSMADELAEAVLEATAAHPLREKGLTEIESSRSEKLVYRLQRARDSGQLTDFHYRSNMKLMFMAGHENSKALLVSSLLEIAQRTNVQERLYQEIVASDAEDSELKDLPYLTAVIYEALRLYPTLIQFTDREALEPVCLGDGITIPQGTLVGWNAYGIHTDPNSWGNDALEFKPERWGSDVQTINRLVRTYQNRGMFIGFGAWSRACIGADFALLQMRVTISEILRRFSIQKDPSYQLVLNDVAALEPEECQLIFTHRRKEKCESQIIGLK